MTPLVLMGYGQLDTGQWTLVAKNKLKLYVIFPERGCKCIPVIISNLLK